MICVKMKKRLICLLMVLALFAALTGCGESEDVGGKITPATENATVPAGTVQQTPETTEAAETVVPETTVAAAEENTVSLGRMEGGIYTNTYAGFACELDSNWTFYSAEELQELPDQINELLSDTEFADTAESLTQITDMMAENVNDLTTMNVLYQKLSMQERLVYAALSEEEIADGILEQSDAMAQAYAQAGIEDAVLEKVTVNFLGEERTAIHTSATIQGINYYILQLFEYHLGQYSVTLTFSSYYEDNTESMLDLFYAAE